MGASVRELIGELSRIEDAVRKAGARTAAGAAADGGPGPLRALLAREEEILHELHTRSVATTGGADVVAQAPSAS